MDQLDGLQLRLMDQADVMVEYPPHDDVCEPSYLPVVLV